MSREEWRDLGVEEEEHYLVAAIRAYLLTEPQRAELYQRNISIEDVLNGRTTGEQSRFVEELFTTWNAQLGWKCFGDF